MKFNCEVDSMLNTSTDKRDQYEIISVSEWVSKNHLID